MMQADMKGTAAAVRQRELLAGEGQHRGIGEMSSGTRACIRATRVFSPYGVRASPLLAESEDYAVFSVVSPSSAMLRSRMTNFWILPVTVIGKASTKR